MHISLSRVFQRATISIVALLVFGIVLSLGGVTPELFAPAFFLGLLLVVLCVGKLLFLRQVPWKTSPMHWPVLAFFVYGLTRYFTSSIEYEARIEAFHIILCAAVYFVCANEFGTAQHRRVLILVLAGLAVFESMYGVWQALSKTDAIFHWVRPSAYQGRASGTFICPNHLAGCLEIMLGLVAARVAYVKAEASTIERSMLVKLGLIYAVAVIAAGIAFSQSRAGWLAAIAGLFFVAIWGRRMSGQLLGRLTLLLLILVGVGALLLNTDSGWRRFSLTFKQEPAGGLKLADSTLGGRLFMWKGTFEMVKEHPVFGSGPGSWQWLYQLRRDPSTGHPEYTHNDYLNLVSDYGLVGGVIMGWLLVAFFRHALVLTRKGSPDEQRAFAVGAVAAVTALLVHSWFDFNLHIPANAVLLAAVMGTMAAMPDSANRYPVRHLGFSRFVIAASAAGIVVMAGWLFVPTVTAAHFADLAHGFKRRLEYDAAAYFHQRATAADTRSPQAHISLGEIYLVQASFRLGPAQQDARRDLALLAAEAFDRALVLNPYLTAAWMGRGRAYEMAKDDEQALESYQKAVKIDPVNASIYFRLGCYYRDRGQDDLAEKQFDRSHRLNYDDNSAGLNLYDIHNR
jgi:O-antigen ligase